MIYLQCILDIYIPIPLHKHIYIYIYIVLIILLLIIIPLLLLSQLLKHSGIFGLINMQKPQKAHIEAATHLSSRLFSNVPLHPPYSMYRCHVDL